MKRLSVNAPARLSALALAASLAGCSWTSLSSSSETVDYKAPTTKSKPLDVPPDLTQLSRENRYVPQGGVVSASTGPVAGAPAAAPTAVAATAVAAQVQGELRIERSGQQRWLVVPIAPERLWPQVKAFWAERGFVLVTESPEIGIMETDWAENRAKLPNDFIRSTIGRVFGNLYDTGERDRYRTRIERTATGSEVYISHRGLQEVYADQQQEITKWQPRPSDPQLEAEFLARLMVKLGAKEEVARTAAVASPAEAPARARALAGSPALEVDEPFDRAWRRVGLALDRGGFTVEDRDRAAGVYFVRYVDPKSAGKDEPNFFSRMFGGDKDAAARAPVRYRVEVKAQGEKTRVAVLTSAGAPDSGESGQRIVTQLVTELR